MPALETGPETSGFAPDSLQADLVDLYTSFGGSPESLTMGSLFNFAKATLDFRGGKSREDTVWEEGLPLTLDQKQATLGVAAKWRMLETSYPTQPFEHMVILGAHYSSLRLRMQHAASIQACSGLVESPDLIALSCFRPIHPKEGIDTMSVDTEADLAVSLLEEDLGGRFEINTVSSWDDLPSDREREPGEYAVAFIGRIGTRSVTIISGSVPGASARATTMSTLGSLKTYLEPPARLLFVTTALHLPYQSLQIDQVMQEFDCEVVGVNYESLREISLDSPDSKYRMLLQEIGATIKNSLNLSVNPASHSSLPSSEKASSL